MDSEILAAEKEIGESRNQKAAFFWKIVSELTGIYLWFLSFSNFLARLVQ